jgi:hypothetical protein
MMVASDEDYNGTARPHAAACTSAVCKHRYACTFCERTGLIGDPSKAIGDPSTAPEVGAQYTRLLPAAAQSSAAACQGYSCLRPFFLKASKMG